MTTTEAPEAPLYYGCVIIEWPAPLRKGEHRPLAGWACSIFDAETGKMIVTAEKIYIPAVTASAQRFITCELLTGADDDGKPVLFPGDDGKLPLFKDDDGEIRRGTFPFLVAEMRIRS
jgi:hypothetical protein